MPRLRLEALGRMVREQRGDKTLRAAAREIGISAPTLMRIEAGRVPDVPTFGRVCLWLEVDPGDFLGVSAKDKPDPNAAPVEMTAHLRADKQPEAETIKALAHMLLLAAELQRSKAAIDAEP